MRESLPSPIRNFLLCHGLAQCYDVYMIYFDLFCNWQFESELHVVSWQFLHCVFLRQVLLLLMFMVDADATGVTWHAACSNGIVCVFVLCSIQCGQMLNYFTLAEINCHLVERKITWKHSLSKVWKLSFTIVFFYFLFCFTKIILLTRISENSGSLFFTLASKQPPWVQL